MWQVDRTLLAEAERRLSEAESVVGTSPRPCFRLVARFRLAVRVAENVLGVAEPLRAEVDGALNRSANHPQPCLLSPVPLIYTAKESQQSGVA